MARSRLAENLGLDAGKKWCLMTYHAETRKSLEYNISAVRGCLDALTSIGGLQVVMTYANADFGGARINGMLEEAAKGNPARFKAVPSLGQLRYQSFMKQASLVIGNSSSGIVEAPFLGIPVVNVGERQKGRHLCGNIIQCDNAPEAIADAVRGALEKALDKSDCGYWGDGHTSEKVMRILHEQISG